MRTKPVVYDDGRPAEPIGISDAHSVAEFRDPTNPAHRQLIDILQGLARD